jgi:hypothetical protein
MSLPSRYQPSLLSDVDYAADMGRVQREVNDSTKSLDACDRLRADRLALRASLAEDRSYRELAQAELDEARRMLAHALGCCHMKGRVFTPREIGKYERCQTCDACSTYLAKAPLNALTPDVRIEVDHD